MQPRLRAHEGALVQAHEPVHGLLRRRREIVIPGVMPGILSQPALLRPAVEVLLRRAPRQFARLLGDIVEKEVEILQDLLRLNAPPMRSQELAVEERRQQRCLIRTKQTPGGMIAPQRLQEVKRHVFRNIQRPDCSFYIYSKSASSCLPTSTVVMMMKSGRTKPVPCFSAVRAPHQAPTIIARPMGSA